VLLILVISITDSAMLQHQRLLSAASRAGWFRPLMQDRALLQIGARTVMDIADATRARNATLAARFSSMPMLVVPSTPAFRRAILMSSPHTALVRRSASTQPTPPAPDAKGTGQATAEHGDKPVEDEAKVGKFRQLWNKYGVVAIVTYFGIYLVTLSSVYLLVSTGALGSDAIAIFHKLGLDQYFDTAKISPKAGNFTVAWLLTKFTEPVRLGITIAILPWVARLFGRKVAERAARKACEQAAMSAPSSTGASATLAKAASQHTTSNSVSSSSSSSSAKQ